MREIKFLAYVNNPIHGKGVFPVKSIHFEPFVCEIVMGNEIVNFFDFDDITLFQYTGLKDSKGTEIYEGDLIKTKEYIWLVEPIGSKERDGRYYGLCVSPFGNGEMWFIDESILKGEVIGNICENPELLEREK